MIETLKAIPTRYKGYKFRSRLEARYACFLDAVGLQWEYESQGYDLPSEGKYLPDFWCPQLDAFIEVKPARTWEPTAIYLAGTCQSEWRLGLNLYGNTKLTPPQADDLKHDDFAGKVADWCLDGIATCNVFAFWCDRKDCYGSLVELGIAKGIRRSILVGMPADFRDSLASSGVYLDYNDQACDMWFAEHMATACGVFASPQDMLAHGLQIGLYSEMPPEYRKAQALAVASGKRVVIVFSPTDKDYLRPAFMETVRFSANGSASYHEPMFELCDAAHSELHLEEWLPRSLDAFRSARFEHGESGAT